MAGIDSNALIVAHCDGADGSTTFTDSSQYARTLTATGLAQIDTAQSVFGGASGLFNGVTDDVRAASATDLTFGTGDFTFDARIRYAVVPGVAQYIWAQTAPGTYVYLNSTGFVLAWAASTYATQTWAPSTNTWYHVACVKSGTTFMYFVNGTQVGSTITGVTGSSSQDAFYIGAYPAGGWHNGWLDEVRVSNVARWTTNFTPPTEAYSVASTTRMLALLGVG